MKKKKEKTKEEIKAPCVYTDWSEAKQKETEYYPAVKCKLRCETCGWNPEVRERRLKRRFG